MAISETFRFVVDAITDQAEGNLKKLGSSAESTGASFKSKLGSGITSGIENVTAKVPGATAAMDKLGLSAQGLGSSAASFIASPVAIAGAAVAVGTAVVGMATDFSNTAREIGKFSAISGIGATDASRWVEVAKDAGVEVEGLGASFGKLAQAINTGKLEDLGISIGKTKDGATDLGATFLNVVDAYNSTDDAATKAQIAQAAFGKSWQSLVRLLDEGSTTLKSSLADVGQGQIFSQDDIDKGQALYEATDRLSDAMDGLKRAVGEMAAGPLADVADALGGLAEDAQKVVGPLSAVNDLMGKFHIGPLGELTGAAKGLGILADGLGTVEDAAGSAWDAVTGFFDTSSEKTVEVVPAATAALENEAKAHQAAADAAERQAQQLSAVNDLIDKNTVKALAAFNSQLAYRSAQDSTTEAVKGAADATAKYGEASDQAQASVDAAAKAALGQASAALKVQQDQATANGETLDGAKANSILRGELLSVAGTLAPGSPLRVQLEGYVATLGQIPKTADTKVTADTSKAQAAIDALLQRYRSAFSALFGGGAPGSTAGASTSASAAPVGLSAASAAPTALPSPSVGLGRSGGLLAPAAIYNVRVEVPPTVNVAEVGRNVAGAIDAFERRNGRRRRAVA